MLGIVVLFALKDVVVADADACRVQMCLDAHLVHLASSWTVLWLDFCFFGQWDVLALSNFGGFGVCRTRISCDILQWCVEGRPDDGLVCHHLYPYHSLDFWCLIQHMHKGLPRFLCQLPRSCKCFWVFLGLGRELCPTLPHCRHPKGERVMAKTSDGSHSSLLVVLG